MALRTAPERGIDELVEGNQLRVGIGGRINIVTGGVLAIASVAIVSSAAELNLMDASNTEPSDGAWASVSRWAKAQYDFDVDGGSQGAIDLNVDIPDNAIIIGGHVEGLTTCVSSNDSGTGALHVLSANDIVSTVAIDDGSDPWNAPDISSIVPARTGDTSIKLTSEKAITFTIATQDFTAGKFNVWLEYVIGG